MKKNRHSIIVAAISLCVLLSSCARNTIQFAGHYHPKIQYGPTQAQEPSKVKQDKIEAMKPAAKEELSATSSEQISPKKEAPKFKVVIPDTWKSPTPQQLKKTEHLAKKIDKVIQKQSENPSPSATSAGDDNQAIAVLVAILIPWLGVYVYEGEITNHFWIALILWIFFYLPGLIYALIIILGGD